MRQKYIISTILLFLQLNFNFKFVNSRHTVKGTLRTDNPFDSWEGEQWGSDEFCPEDEFVVGFKIRYQPFQGLSLTTGKMFLAFLTLGIYNTVERLSKSHDDLGLTRIELICAKSKSEDYHIITSKFHPSVKHEKETSKLICPHQGYAIGFQLKTLEAQGSKDDVGATNFQIKCEDDTILKNSIEYEPGEWPKAFQTCPENTRICGLRTSVETEHHDDDSGLNAVEIYCCHVKHLSVVDRAKTCTPKMEWQVIKEYDNTDGFTSQTNTYEEKIGMTKLNSNRELEKKGKTNSAETAYDIGTTLTHGDEKVLQVALAANFHQAFISATSKEQESEKLLSQSMDREVRHTVSFETPVGVISRFFQLVGSCDIFKVHSIQFRREDKLVNRNGHVVKSKTEEIVRKV